ncbi:MAG: hypothetical protein ACI3X1_06540 [Eubacteriales bacterium]
MLRQKVSASRRLLRTAIALCLAAICFTSVGVSFAKYNSEANAHDSANAALFSPLLSSDENIDVSGIKKPGDEVEKTFRVHNSSGGKPSEVTMKYKIILKTTGNLPLIFTLLDGEGTVLKTWDCDGTSGKQEYIFENNSLCFNAETSEHHDYKLKVEWQGDRKDADFSGMTDAVYLSVIWDQVD